MSGVKKLLWKKPGIDVFEAACTGRSGNVNNKLREFKDLTAPGYLVKSSKRELYMVYCSDKNYNQDRSKMSVVAVHPDSKSIETLMDRGKEEFRKFSDCLELLKIDVFGEVSESVIERLHLKADMLGEATVSIHTYKAGFVREIEEWTS